MAIVCVALTSGSLKLIDVDTLTVLKSIDAPGAHRIGCDDDGNIMAIINGGSTSRRIAKNSFAMADTALTAGFSSTDSIPTKMVYSSLGYFILPSYSGYAIRTIDKNTGQIANSITVEHPEGCCLVSPSELWISYFTNSYDRIKRHTIGSNGSISAALSDLSGMMYNRLHDICVAAPATTFVVDDLNGTGGVTRQIQSGNTITANRIAITSESGFWKVCPNGQGGAYASSQYYSVYNIKSDMSYQKISLGSSRGMAISEDGLGGCVTGHSGGDGNVCFISSSGAVRKLPIGNPIDICLYKGPLSALYSGTQCFSGGM